MKYHNHKNHKRRQWHSKLPEHTTLGIALVKAMQEQKEELKDSHIFQSDWVDILKKGGSIKFQSSGAVITLPHRKENTHRKRVYLGE